MGKRVPARRRRLYTRALPLGLGLTALLVGGGAALTGWPQSDPTAEAAAPEDEEPGSRATTKPPPSPTASPPSTESPSAEPGPEAPSRIPIPPDGPGTFTTARSTGSPVGSGGTVRRYKVQVEKGIDLSEREAAVEIETILAHPRGWTSDGRHSFRLVGSGPSDFEVKIATPGTVDRICGAAGLLTRGEVNCTVGRTVVVNLKRWVLGSEQFDGPVTEYRALIINHEVGHRIAGGHVTCGGAGKPAPAMMQQIKGLRGCHANAWPYAEDGTYITGPAVP
ncbi:DUF3152 domain-containing protein [Streptomyces sp. NBC_00838]|uniref:DUF3152 domain-containing protein n=1 Tax=Streptomyces sp. NBC_00838 TaxID=2903680 RepID=UPI00386DBE34|nr:DUF3152 domain-containing protein [Streptomyces sp. NBC_00838]